MEPSRLKMGNPKPIFRNLVISGVGNLQRPGGNGQFTDKNIARWVTLRGGMYLRPGVGVISPSSSAEDGEDEEKDGVGAGRKKNGGKKEVDAKLPEEVTHLVCSKETFWEMGAVGTVQEALKRKKVEIVELDWLEDSAINNRREPTYKYSHRRAMEKGRKRQLLLKKFEEGIKKGIKEVNTNLYRVYMDDTFFSYEVTITREDEIGNTQRYVLTLYESYNSRPHMYWFVAKFYKKKGDSRPSVYRPSIAAGMLCREYGKFASFFETKTGIPWEQRLVRQGVPGKFQYQPPTGGKPLGWVPPEFMPSSPVPVPATLPDHHPTSSAVNNLLLQEQQQKQQDQTQGHHQPALQAGGSSNAFNLLTLPTPSTSSSSSSPSLHRNDDDSTSPGTITITTTTLTTNATLLNNDDDNDNIASQDHDGTGQRQLSFPITPPTEARMELITPPQTPHATE
ncbi:hypothetical protein VTJ04DRAFT_369 [Mycothermus thermophilus]|uniref:uncharacterized protein n=1 Tax=Humicola insolens TaxID=85995 RepID=UPI00374383A9